MSNVRIVYRDYYGSSGEVSLEVYKDPAEVLFKGACRDPLRPSVPT